MIRMIETLSFPGEKEETLPMEKKLISDTF